jgi:hypothetical protein
VLRLKALEAKLAAAVSLILTEAQVQALEKRKLDEETCGEIETAHPGYLGSQDTFYFGTLKGLQFSSQRKGKMLKYYFIFPLTYKILSSTSMARKLYRFLGNSLRRKCKMQMFEMRRVRDLITSYCELKHGSEVLELGTGWMHRYSIFLRLFQNINLTLFDVWDNRQFTVLKHYIEQLSARLTDEEMERAAPVLSSIKEVGSFDELYQILGCRYEIEENGGLSRFANSQFDILFSCNVLEHIRKEILSEYIYDIKRILAPGGYSAQIIDIGDHYHYFDKRDTHVKEYLKFTNRLWNRYFDNRIQYINRMQRSDWMKLFEEHGFDLVYKREISADISSLRVSNDFSGYSVEELECIRLLIVHQKPRVSGDSGS